MRIAIIGNGPAAVTAVEALNFCRNEVKENKLEIIMISDEPCLAYAPMFLMNYVAGEITENQLYIRSKDSYDKLGVETLFGKYVQQIDSEDKRLALGSGEEIRFDRLLITTGASPLIPSIDGIGKEGVYLLSRLADAKKISHVIKSGAKNVIVVGAGMIGMEAAVILNKTGLDVTLIELANQILPQTLQYDMSEFVKEELQGKNIKVMLGRKLSEIPGGTRAEGILLEGGEKLESDFILITTGVKPNVDVITSTGVKIRGGIVVNEKMGTSVPYIYAAGDVAEARNVFGEYALDFTWYSAVEQGWVAGCNLAGVPKKIECSPFLKIVKGLKTPVVAIGREPTPKDEILTYLSKEQGIFEKIFLRGNQVVGYQGTGAGVADKVGFIYSLIKSRRNIGRFKDKLHKRDFNFTSML